MLEIKNVNEDTFDLLHDFLVSVPSINNLDDAVVKNASIIFDNKKIVGCLSFEIFNNVGLVRYFIFKKGISTDVIKELIDSVLESCRKDNLERLVCFADNGEIKKLFEQLGFSNINKKIFVNEDDVNNTAFAESTALQKMIFL